MRMSRAFLATLRAPPADAEVPSHVLLARSGLLSKLGAGVPLGVAGLQFNQPGRRVPGVSILCFKQIRCSTCPMPCLREVSPGKRRLSGDKHRFGLLLAET